MAKINDENLLISIIIPVYNAEKYIEQCLNSIKNQTYNYFEVILVNDGSKDNSENICKKFSNSDARFRYFVKEHGGVSSARNLGLDNAQGYYITFIDSDDWVDENHLELLVNNIKENNSDMAVSSIKNFNNIDTFYFRANTNQEKYLLNFNKMRKEEFLVNLPKLILAQNSYKIVVSKLFKKDFIHDIRFEETIIYVNDTQFLFDLYLKMNSISYINEATYIYRLHDESPSSNFNQQYTEQELLIYKKMYEKIAELNLPTIHYVNTIRKFLDLQKDFLEKL